MAGYTIKNRLTDLTSIVQGASVTAAAVTKSFKISDSDSLHTNVAVTASSVTGTATIILQSSFDGGTTWIDSAATGTISNGTTQFDLNVSNGSDTQIWPLGRVVLTTAGASGATIDAVYVSTRL